MPRPNVAPYLRRRLLEQIRRQFESDPPSLRLLFSDGEAFSFCKQPKVTLELKTAKLHGMLLRGDIGGLADAYVSGDLGVQGTIEDVLDVGIKIAERLGKSPLVKRLAWLRSNLPRRRRTRRQEAANVAYHYDVSNDFYRLWLDEAMVYSCAYFKNGREDIDLAQQQKLDHICRKLRLRPGERLLDIGCGWGALLRFAAKKYGVSAVGVTLSEEQRRYAADAVARDGLGDKIDVKLLDYRDVEGAFDKIVSVGMYEHVGLANHAIYFQTMARLLKPGGAALNHGVVVTDPAGKAKGPPGGEFIDRHVFPGGELAHVSAILREMGACGLETVDMEDLRPHYARTLSLWSRRLEANAAEAERLAGPERLRIWRIFLPGMGLAFERGWLSVVQVLALKPLPSGMASRPWTRAYQYEEGPPPTRHPEAHRLSS